MLKRYVRAFAFCIGTALFLMVGVLDANATELKYFQTFTNIDYVSAGVGGLREVGRGTINLTGVSGTVKRAYLYWHGHGHPNDYDPNRTTGSVYFTDLANPGAAQFISGDLIGTSGSDGWSFDPFNLTFGQAFRADVTALVQGNGNYALSNFDPFGLTVQGASLIVIFDDSNPDNNRDIVITDGCDQNSVNSFDATGWNISFPGVNYSVGDAVEMEFHVSDGQSLYLESALYLNGQLLAPAVPYISNRTGQQIGQVFDGSAPYNTSSGFRRTFFTGSLWDIKTFNIVPLLLPGVNNLYITSGYEDDDLTVVALVAKLKSGGSVGGTVENSPPSVNCSGMANYGCATSAGVTNITQATISDSDGDPITLTWRLNGTVVRQETVAAGNSINPTTFSVTNVLKFGNYTVSAVVQDSKGAASTCDSTVIVETDTTPPAVDGGPIITVTAASNGSAVVPNVLGQVVASDSCTPANQLLFAQLVPPGTAYPVGTYRIGVSVTDANGNVGTGYVVFIVTPYIAPLNNPPVAIADSASTLANVPVSISVLVNDSDPNGDSLQIVSVASLVNGTAVINANGTITFTPTAGFTGVTTFQYTISDGRGGLATATVTVTVTAVAGSFTTFTQGGWGSTPSGNNPGALLANNFARVFPAGVTIGGKYKLTFTSSAAVDAFLPQGGGASALTKTATNPTGKLTVFAGQTLALQLSVGFSNSGVLRSGLGGMVIASGKLKGWTVDKFLALCNQVLGGTNTGLPSGVAISDLNTIADTINQNFDNGTVNKGYLIKL